MGSFREDVRDQMVAIRETIVDGWNDFVQFVREVWPALVVLLIGIVVAIWFARPAPPDRVLMATGAKGTSYEALGKKYAAYFAKQGITLELVATEGSLENIRRLKDRNDPLMAAFTISGTVKSHEEAAGIQTLGSVDYQPAWVFYRADRALSPLTRVHEIVDKNVNVGAPGSGTFLLANKILELNGVQTDHPNFKHMSEYDAIAALENGKIDAMFIVDAFESPNIQKLLSMPGLQLADFTRAEAYKRVEPALEHVTVPEGGFSLANNNPDHGLNLIAGTTEILVDDRLHPAIQMLFLEAARAINGRQSFFSREGEFPSFKDTALTRSHEAEIYYAKGTPLLMDYLPFWLAEFIRRMVVTLLPLFAVAYPVIRSMPNYHKNRIRGRINRMYGGLKFFEQELVSSYDPTQKSVYLARLDGMERDALSMKVPKSVSSDYYTLRSTIDFVRNCLIRDGYDVHLQTAQPALASDDTEPDETNDE